MESIKAIHHPGWHGTSSIEILGQRIDSVITGAAERRWGEQQIDILVEEMSELIVELLHYRRGRGVPTHLAEEMADVLISMDSVIKHLDVKANSSFCPVLRDFVGAKMNRLEEMLKEDKDV